MAKGLEFTIVVALVLFFVTLVVTFVLSYYAYEHVTYLIPYISDTGTLPPESCWFGQGLNILWVLMSFIVYLKFSQVKYIVSKKGITNVTHLNAHALVVGWLSTFGMSIVGNFQETNAIVIHWIGATMIFGFGSLYLCIMANVYNSMSMYFDRTLILLRFILSTIAVSTFLIFFISGMVAFSQFDGQNYLHWTKEYGGFGAHLTSTVSEWICAASIAMYYIMYFWEFKKISVYEPIILYNLPETQTHTATHITHVL